jgi:hypothetical protein
VSLRARNDLLDELCADLGRDPASLERAYFFGWAIERPFESGERLRDYLGRYGEAGTDRFVFRPRDSRRTAWPSHVRPGNRSRARSRPQL